jgi:hypothetical protein
VSQCSKCGGVSQGSVAFCTQCGSAIPVPTSTSFAGRPIVSMDPRKQAQVSENPGGPATLMQPHATSPQQISNIQPSQFQSLPITPQVSSSSSNTNKIAIGEVGVIVAIFAIVFLLGRNDSESPSVSPSNQQSGSSSSEESDEFVENYAGYDDYSIEFRDAFMDSCTAAGNYLSCLCSLEKIESLYSIVEVGAIFDSGEDLSWFYEQIGSGCF